MDKIIWTNRVKNEQVLRRVREERNVLHKLKRRRTSWIGHSLRRNCLIKHVIEGKIDEKRTRVWRSEQLLDDPKEKITYWIWKRKHCIALFCRKLWTYHKTDHAAN